MQDAGQHYSVMLASIMQVGKLANASQRNSVVKSQLISIVKS